MLTEFSLIFVADAKIIFGHHFGAPLKEELYILSILTVAPNRHADARIKKYSRFYQLD